MSTSLKCVACHSVLEVADAPAEQPPRCPRCGGSLRGLTKTKKLRDDRYVPPPLPETVALAPAAVQPRQVSAAPEPAPAGEYAQHLLAALALFCGSLAIVLASILPVAVKPLAGLGCVLGGAAWGLARRHQGWQRQLRPGLATALCLAVLFLAGSWRDLRGPLPTHSSLDPDRPIVVSTVGHGMTPSKNAAADDWVDAGTGMVQQNDVRVRLLSAAVDVVPYKTPPTDPAAGPKRLLLKLRLSSVNYTQPVNYETWADAALPTGKHEPRLKDNLDRAYPRLAPGADAAVTGMSGNTYLTAWRPAEDLLIFEAPPLDQVQFLLLELPASAIGGKGAFRLKIPRYIIAGKDN
jgi:hypothetical protein